MIQGAHQIFQEIVNTKEKPSFDNLIIPLIKIDQQMDSGGILQFAQYVSSSSQMKSAGRQAGHMIEDAWQTMQADPIIQNKLIELKSSSKLDDETIKYINYINKEANLSVENRNKVK